MKVNVQSKKGLRTTLSIEVDKKFIQQKMNDKLNKIQSEVSLKGFRPGKVPPAVIKNQFGKAIYGEVIDQLLKETSNKAIQEKKIRLAGQPKIDLKSFGEGKNLNYELHVDSLPEIKLKPFENFKATNYKIKVENKIIEDKLKEISEQHKSFTDKKDEEKANSGDQIIFDYSATVDGQKFEGSEGKGVQLELGKDLFLKGFDQQLIGAKKNDIKNIDAILPANHPKKELANKKTKFECKILNVKKPEKTEINDKFAIHMGAKNILDLKRIIDSQISSQYSQALSSITKKEILDQLEKAHNLELPKNLIENEILTMTQNLKKEEVEKNQKNNELLAKSRIKLGLILNEIGEQNKIKVNEDEIKSEIQKQIKGMPGQEKMVYEYYQKNPNAAQSLRGALYEEKIINLIKSKIKLISKDLSTKEAEKVISNFNKPNKEQIDDIKSKQSSNNKTKSKKISKK